MTGLCVAVLALSLVAGALCLVRFLRVAQREHYLPGAPARFFWRWWASARAGPGLLVLAGLAGLASIAYPATGILAAVIVGAGPPGFGLRGRTGRLSWTRRLSLLAVGSGVAVALVPVVLVLLVGPRAAAPAAVLAALCAPLLIEVALRGLAPLEEHVARRYIAAARTRLQRVAPRVVAITGSYGKTSTKAYVEGLLSARYEVLASPRSFNNRAGLARTVNERLAPGTEVLVAEMGTYGPGEIAALCEWMRPEIAVITAIGPVHLERFGSLSRTLSAKAEICAGAATIVVNIDDDHLAELAIDHEARATLWRCSARDTGASVCVTTEPDGLHLYVRGADHGALALSPELLVAPTNLACAIGVALALDLSPGEVAGRVASLGPVESRLTTTRTAEGVTVLDDTFNSNPAGAVRALAALEARARPGRRRVVVTPGMVELGPLQHEENARFGEHSAGVATDLVVVGRTNRRALVEGAARAAPEVSLHLVATRPEAVSWVRASCREGDVVLYENDLPDHYP